MFSILSLAVFAILCGQILAGRDTREGFTGLAEALKSMTKRETFTNNNFGPGNHVNNNNSPQGPGGSFTNNNFGFSGQTFINNNNGNGRPGETIVFNNNFDPKFGSGGMIVNNNGGGPGSISFTNNNGFEPGVSVVNNNGAGDGTIVQPIFATSDNSRVLIGYNVIQNNKIINTIMTPMLNNLAGGGPHTVVNNNNGRKP